MLQRLSDRKIGWKDASKRNKKITSRNTHELCIVEQPDIAWDEVKANVIEHHLNSRQVFLFDDSIIDQSTLILDSGENDPPAISAPLIERPFFDTLILSHQQKFSQIWEFFRKLVWDSINKSFRGVCFIFKFNEFLINRDSVLDLEYLISNLFQRSFGFPIECICLYPNTLSSLDLGRLIELHTGVRILGKQRTTGHGTLIDSEERDQLLTHGQQVQPRTISPFVFRKGDQIVGVADDLASFCFQLENIPLDVFCFHSFRTLSQNDSSASPRIELSRSDIALWIQYSIGDNSLAHTIYETIRASVGRMKSLSSISRFGKLTIRTTILDLIREKIAKIETGF